MTENTMFLSGGEALARGAFEWGLKVACSYPGTPATEILEHLAGYPEVDSQWSVNEKVAFEVALAASIAGLPSLYSSKHVGLNVAMDPLMTSAYTGVNAGFVIVTADDPGLHSSQNEQDNRLIARFAKLPLIEPASAREAYEFIKHALTISEEFDTPVMVRLTTRVAHAKENVAVGTRAGRPAKEFKINAAKFVMVPKNAYARHIELEKRLEVLAEYSERTRLNRMELKNKDLGIITSGLTYLYAKEMYPEASFLKLGFSYPFPDGLIKQFASRVKEVVVLEELEPFIEEHVRSLGIKIKAKHPSFRVGELRPELIPPAVKGEVKPASTLAPARKPVLCPGCSHRAVFATLRKMKLTVAGDIGCYTLGALEPLAALHSCVCMGTGVTFFEGFAKALGKKTVGVIGDSTFVHSGITGLVNAVYNGAKGLVIILDNGTTAMTGAQPNPATGKTAKDENTKQLDLEKLCLACGADAVDVVEGHNVKEIENTIRKRLSEDALSVLIARYPCRMIERTRQPAPEFYRDRCKKCGICFSLDCPALVKTAEGYVEINQSLCAGCDLCVKHCAFGALKSGRK